MKTRVLMLLMCMVVSIFNTAQVLENQLMEVKVTPPGFTQIKNVNDLDTDFGDAAIGDFLSRYFEYPEGQFMMDGTSVIRLTVSPQGNLTNFKVMNSLSRQIDAEMIRVLKTSNGMWKPGQNNGEPTAMETEVAMVIKAGETEGHAIRTDFRKIALYNFKKGRKKILC